MKEADYPNNMDYRDPIIILETPLSLRMWLQEYPYVYKYENYRSEIGRLVGDCIELAKQRVFNIVNDEQLKNKIDMMCDYFSIIPDDSANPKPYSDFYNMVETLIVDLLELLSDLQILEFTIYVPFVNEYRMDLEVYYNL